MVKSSLAWSQQSTKASVPLEFCHCAPQGGISTSRTPPASPLRGLFPLGNFWVLSPCHAWNGDKCQHSLWDRSRATFCGCWYLCSACPEVMSPSSTEMLHFCKFIYRMVQFALLPHFLCAGTSALQIQAAFSLQSLSTTVAAVRAEALVYIPKQWIQAASYRDVIACEMWQ